METKFRQNAEKKFAKKRPETEPGKTLLEKALLGQLPIEETNTIKELFGEGKELDERVEKGIKAFALATMLAAREEALTEQS
jgi:hypothetical protein